MIEGRRYSKKTEKDGKIIAKDKDSCGSHRAVFAESIKKSNSKLEELFDRTMKGCKEAEIEFFSHGLKTLPYLFEAFCSESEVARFRSISLLAKLMPWEMIDSIRERFKNGVLKLTDKEKEIIQKNLNRYFEASSP